MPKIHTNLSCFSCGILCSYGCFVTKNTHIVHLTNTNCVTKNALKCHFRFILHCNEIVIFTKNAENESFAFVSLKEPPTACKQSF